MKRLTLVIAIITAALALSACGGGGGGGGGGEGASPASGQVSFPQNTALDPDTATGPVNSAYDVTLLGSFAGNSFAVALNDATQVTGNYTDQNGRINAFIWESGIVSPVVSGGQASRINNHGQVVGWMEPNGHPEAYVYEGAGQVYRLNTVGGSSQALAINDSGLIAGRISNGRESAFLEDNGTLSFIAAEVAGYAIAMNNVGQVLVKRLDADGFRTLLWQNGTFIDMGTLGGLETQGRDINDAGQVVGWSQTADGQQHAFLWENGTMIDLAPLAGEFSAAVAINDHGQILLKSSDILESRNLLYENGEVTDLGNFGAGYAVVNDLNNQGEIVGWLSTENGQIRAFLARPNSGSGL
jgi:probable HAF family extracellular repeat protein